MKPIFTYKSFKYKKYNLEDEGFKVNDDLSFTHSAFNGLEIKGGQSIIETIEKINQYIDVMNMNPMMS